MFYMAQRELHLVYHLADERNFESIQVNGLLSAEQLLKRAGLDDWINYHRHENIQLPNGTIIRDQRPIPPKALKCCLDKDLTPEDWYALLNSYVFFWIDKERLERQRRACKTPQYVISVNAKELLMDYSFSAAVTPFNTGNARRSPAPRGLTTFVPYNNWVDSGWKNESNVSRTKSRSPNHKPVELTIKDSVSNIFDYVINVQRL